MTRLVDGQWSKVPHSVVDIPNELDFRHYVYMRMVMWKDGKCRHSQERRARELGYGVRAIQLSQQRLELAGWVSTVKEGRRKLCLVLIPHNKDLFEKGEPGNVNAGSGERRNANGETAKGECRIPETRMQDPRNANGGSPQLDSELDSEPDTQTRRQRESDRQPDCASDDSLGQESERPLYIPF